MCSFFWIKKSMYICLIWAAERDVSIFADQLYLSKESGTVKTNGSFLNGARIGDRGVR